MATNSNGERSPAKARNGLRQRKTIETPHNLYYEGRFVGEADTAAYHAEDDPFKNLPLLGFYASDPQLRKERPFAGLQHLLLLHFLDNLLPLVTAMQRLGMEPANTIIFHKGPGYRYPHKRRVTDALRKRGFTVCDLTTLESAEGQAAFITKMRERTCETGRRMLITEDGGHLSPLLFRDPVLAESIVGVTEQTTRGIRRIRAATNNGRSLRCPVVSLPDSELKKQFEPPQIAAGVDRAVANMLCRRMTMDMRAAVLGAGAIGRALIDQLAAQRIPVSVFDPKAQARLIARNLNCEVCCSAEQAVRDADLVYGTCGDTSVDESVISHLKHGVYVASVSSEQVEVDVKYLEQIQTRKEPVVYDFNPDLVIGHRYVLRQDGRAINLLGDGYPINFLLDFGGMADQAADLIVTLLFLGPLEIARGMYAGRNRVLRRAVDRYVKTYRVCEQYHQIWA